MARKPNHKLSAEEQYRGQITSRERANENARIRQEGWFIDAARFIMDWRLADGEGNPPVTDVVKFLDGRGWTAERGGKVSREEVSRMLTAMDPDGFALPAHKADWNFAEDRGQIIPGTEITSVAIDPEGWLEFRQAKMDGWKPSWRNRTIKSEGSGEDL